MSRNWLALAVAIGLLSLVATSQYGLAEDGQRHLFHVHDCELQTSNA